ncbi:MAG: M16 family metallopeptidase [Polyangiales bacterium]
MSRATRTFPFVLLLGACATTGAPPPEPPKPTAPASVAASTAPAPAPKQQPPAPAARREVKFPAIARSQTPNGLELDTVELRQLPVVDLKLVIRSGSAADPENMPGLAHLTATMLKEGTQKRNSQKLAEAIDFLGAHLNIGNDTDRVYIEVKALSDHFVEALELLAEIAQKPAFDKGELDKLKKRELSRLELQSQNPRFLANRELHKALYGAHPYGHVDTTKAVVERVQRADLARWHGQHFAPNNAILVVAGDVDAAQVEREAARVFGSWKKHEVPALATTTLPSRDKREVVLVDRPKSVQSLIYAGNLALARRDPEFVPLMVANQVLGGSAASRLFMDLREKRSLTYGAYSDVDERVQVAPFMAFAAVRNEVTKDALSAFDEHLHRIVREAPAQDELVNAKHYLVDRFPLRIESPDKIAEMVADLRNYGLPDDYWARFNDEIEQVSPAQALAAAQKYIKPDQGVIVVVGEAAAVKSALDPYGPVTVVDTEGKLVLKPEAGAAAPAPGSVQTKPKADSKPAAPAGAKK